MSRLIVLSLPSDLSTQRLQEHFATLNLPITDAKVLHKKDGTSRRIGFVGFGSSGDAQKAKEWFDGTWLAGSRIKVDFAKDIDEDAHQRKRQRLSEDDFSAPQAVPSANIAGPSSTQHPDLAAQSQVSAYGTAEDTSRIEQSALEDGLSDAEYLSRRMRKSVGEHDSPDQAVVDMPQLNGSPEDKGKDGNAVVGSRSSAADKILSSSRLFLRNLSFQARDSDLQDLFGKYGRLDEVHLPGAALGQPKGIAFIRFAEPQAALRAFQQEDGRSFLGRLLHILPAAPPASDGPQLSERHSELGPKGDHGSSNFKTSRLRSKQDEAASGISRKALFVNNDAVMEAVAARLNTNKASLLGAHSSNAAGRMALAETYLLQEIRDQLVKEGVNIEALQSSGVKSKTTILFKNLPFKTASGTIRSLVAPFGQLRRIVMPDTGLIALVEMESPSEATKAIRALTYSKLNSTVIYVEKAPQDIWEGATTASSACTSQMSPEAADAPIPSDSLMSSSRTSLLSKTLFIKNVSFATSQEAFEQVLQRHAGVETVRLVRSSTGSASRNAGYGFATFKTPAYAQQALHALQGYPLDGHALQIEFSSHKANEDEEPAAVHGAVGKAAATALILKNLPFEVTRSDLLALLNTYGHVKSLRIPRKADNSSRGFAFVHYSSAKEAQAALEGLRDTHVLGRHLIVETTK